EKLGAIKIRIGIFGTMMRLSNYLTPLLENDIYGDNEYNYVTGIPFKSKNMVVLRSTDTEEVFNQGLMRIDEAVQKYVNYGSGWEFSGVEKVFIEIIKFSPPTGAGHINLPKDVASKKGVINPKTKIMNVSNGLFYVHYIQ